MNVLLVNGSPRADGNTAIALKEVSRELESLGVSTRALRVGDRDIRGCVACGSCAGTGRCVFDDVVNEAASLFKEADGLVVGSPVYFASPGGTLISFLDRLFYSLNFDTTMKVGASVVVCRRGGASASFDALNKYFTISGMPVVSSQYWNSVHGLLPGEAERDAEGLRTMRVLARNMAFLMRAVADAKAKYGLPPAEKRVFTHFIR